MIRQFERDSEHALHLVVDDTLSMAFRGDDSPHSKFAFAAALAASLGYVALRSGDRVALHWLGGRRASLQTSGVGSFDRLATALEEVEAAQTLEDAKQLEHALLPALKASQRGGIVVLLSDLIDWDEPWQEPLSWLAGGRRKLVLVRVSDRTEEDFSLDGAVQLEATEGKHRVLTEPRRVRTAYLESRHAHLESWRRFLVERGAALLTMVTDEPLTGATRRVLSAIAGAEAA